MKEIEEHKTFMNEKDDRAYTDNEVIDDWIKYQAPRFNKDYMDHIDAIDEVCKRYCNYECKGLDECVLQLEKVHTLLEDGKECKKYM